MNCGKLWKTLWAVLRESGRRVKQDIGLRAGQEDDVAAGRLGPLDDTQVAERCAFFGRAEGAVDSGEQSGR